MDKEYIDREKAMEIVKRTSGDYAAAWSEIRQLPAADVAPVVYAKWKPYQPPNKSRQVGWICTNCSSVIEDLSNGDTDFCPHCGAVMETEE